MKITILDKDYEINTTLRVAYEAQKHFGGVPYATVFNSLQTGMLEDHILIIYVAFNMTNPDIFTHGEFMEILLENWTLEMITKTLQEIISGITGRDLDDDDTSSKEKKIPKKK